MVIRGIADADESMCCPAMELAAFFGSIASRLSLQQMTVMIFDYAYAENKYITMIC